MKDAVGLLKLINAVREWRLADENKKTVLTRGHEGDRAIARRIASDSISELRMAADMYFRKDTTQ